MTRITRPIDGAILNHNHGVLSDKRLTITVSGTAEGAGPVLVNDRKAAREEDRFSCEVALEKAETTVQVTQNNEEDSITVLWDIESRPRYRFQIDDNIFFLRDIAAKNYSSLFDSFYLSIMRRLHDRYGTKTVLNLFYSDGADFDLSMVPDRFKAEWRDNADWLRLTFHAHSEFPDRPYRTSSGSTILHDFERVEEQIVRFAGESTFCLPSIIHWADVSKDALHSLAKRGVKVLSTLVAEAEQGFDLNYGLTNVQSEYLLANDAFRDPVTGIVFSDLDIICNKTPLADTAPTLRKSTHTPETSEILDLLTHEQYFWPFYKAYVPDHAERLDAAMGWADEQGYAPVFFNEGAFGLGKAGTASP